MTVCEASCLQGIHCSSGSQTADTSDTDPEDNTEERKKFALAVIAAFVDVVEFISLRMTYCHPKAILCLAEVDVAIVAWGEEGRGLLRGSRVSCYRRCHRPQCRARHDSTC